MNRLAAMPSPEGRPVATQTVETQGWLVIVYRVPSEPTRLRAAVWRRIKGLGAIYLQNSVAALPASVQSERAMIKLRREIVEMGGSAVLLSSTALQGEGDIRGTFIAARNDEYEEIVDKCGDFLRGIQKEFDAEHFSFAELEENEVDHHKLVSWLAKVVERDSLGAPGRAQAEEQLAACQQSLENYAARVYLEEADAH